MPAIELGPDLDLIPDAAASPGPDVGPILVLSGLTRRFGTLLAVADLSFSVAPGEVFGLLGSNGAGKSTTLRMLTTLLKPTEGDARIAGFSIIAQPFQVRRSIGYVPQAVSVDGALTGYENLLLFAKLYDLNAYERQERIREALDFMGLTRDAGRLVGEYSGGMVRRLEIAQATLHRPQVLFLDEPTVGLDPLARGAVWKHLLDLRANHGMTLVFSTHDLGEAQEHCDRVAILQGGRLAALGSCHDLQATLPDGGTMEAVFARYASGVDAQQATDGGTYHEAVGVRATARRLG